jgi:hypothetical protein
MKTFAWSFRSALMGLLLVLSAGSHTLRAQVAVSLPSMSVLPGSTFSIPVNVGSLTGLDVSAFQFNVTCDTNIAMLTGIDENATLSSGWLGGFNNSVNGFNPGRMSVSAASSVSAVGGGVLIYITGTAKNTVGKTTVQLSSFLFNTGTPTASITQGSIRTNRPPTMVSVSAKTVAEKDTLRFTATATDPDLPNDTLSFSLSGAPAGATITSGGSFQWVPDYSTAGNYTPRIKVTDLGGAADSTTVSITVMHKNRAPSFLNKLRDTTINQGSTLTFSYTATDPDNGTTFTYTLSNPPSGASINGSGVLTFTPPANPARTYSIIAFVSDGSLKDSATATVTVNRKPRLNSQTPSSISTVSQNKAQAFSVSAGNPDGGALTFTWKVNGVVDKTGPDSTYSKSFADPHGAAKTVICVFTNVVGLKDSATWSFTITDISTNEGAIPTEFALGQNFPNPFNPTTTLRFDLPKEALVTMEIYNIQGIRIRTLLKGESVSAGRHSLMWDGRDENGFDVPSGVYLYRISAGDFHSGKKMTLLK